MTKLREVYYCEICGNVVTIMNEGQEALVCCGEPMKKLKEQSKDATTEKHVPYIQEVDGGVIVKVGKETAHPMLDKHYIKFIEVQLKDRVCYAELEPGDEPEAFFPVKIGEIVKAREWCTVHGLWKSE